MTLTDCLATQAAALDAYLKLLDEEAQALREGRYAVIPDLVQRKAHLAERLAQMDRLRQQLQAVSGFALDTDAGSTPEHPLHVPVQKAWQHLRERAAAAREANQRNGVLVHTLLAFTREAVGLLHSGGRPLYGPQGDHTQRPAGGRCLGQG